jgi:catechol 2,3-dioxygenase-like lactoylglutathione lyase family enzyme
MTSIRHIGLVVSDLDRAINFYSYVFGFKLIERREESGQYIETLVGLSDVCIEWAKLSDSMGLLLELVCYHSHPDIPLTPPVQRHGISHIAFTVPDINNSVELLIASGGTAGTIQQNTGKTVKVVYARDPEGILLELVENLTMPITS